MGVLFLMMTVISVLLITVMIAGTRRVQGRGPHRHIHHHGPRAHLPGPHPQLPQGFMSPLMASPQGGRPIYPLTPAARQACDSDITTFGTELRDLDLDVVGRTLDAEANQDYTRALDAYDAAKEHLVRAQYDIDAQRVAEILEEGRFAMACVRARVNGRPLPAKRPPCFFDPAHGPSTRDVMWAPQGGAPRQVPACEADAQRVQVGARPQVRMVDADGALVPYWENSDYAPWARGYYRRYGQDPTTSHLVTGAMMIGGFSLLMGLLDDLR